MAILQKLKPLLLKALWIAAALGITTLGGIGVIELKHYINTEQEEIVTDGFACVVHKSRPVHLPQNFLVVFVRPDNEEFYIMEKNIYEHVERGDCVRYRYHEIHEYDKREGHTKFVITGFSYDFNFLERKEKMEKGRGDRQVLSYPLPAADRPLALQKSQDIFAL